MPADAAIATIMTSSHVTQNGVAGSGGKQVIVGNRNMSKEEVEDLRESFDLFDLDRDGRITPVELIRVMRALRLETNEAEIHEMITRADLDGNGTVEFEEFIGMMSRRAAQIAALGASTPSSSTDVDETIRRRIEESEMRQAFRVFDIDGDGLIDVDELRQTMNNLGEKLSDDDVLAMIKEADRNGDGKVDFDEFVQMLHNK